MKITARITRTIQEVQHIEVELSVDDLMDTTVRDAVEDAVASDSFDVLDEDTHVVDTWEVDTIDGD